MANEPDRTVKAGWETLAQTYFRLAEQSEEKNFSEGKSNPILDE